MTGEEIRNCRKANELKQSELADELNRGLGTRGYNKVIISLVENGLVDLPENAESYLASKFGLKAVITDSDARNPESKVIMTSPEKKSLKTEIPENWREKKLKQTERILAYINEEGSITTKEAFDILGIARLASRIHDLSEEGYDFERKTESSPNRFGKAASYTRYSFRKTEDGKENMDRQ